MEEAEKYALDKAKDVAIKNAFRARVVNPEVLVEKEQVFSHTARSGNDVFIETCIEVTAMGRPGREE